MTALNHLLVDVLDEIYNKPTTFCNKNRDISCFQRDACESRLQSVPFPLGFLKPQRCLTVTNTRQQDIENSFIVNLDVQQFKPEEISIKLVRNYIVIEAKHEEREDKDGFVARHFSRRYKLSDWVDKDNLRSTLSSDGVLTLEAPIKEINSDEERRIPIVQTKALVLKSDEQVSRDSIIETPEA